MRVYVNYPNPHFAIHESADCPHIRKHAKVNQRVVSVDKENLGLVLSRFISDYYKFASTPAHNDLWLDVSLATSRQEEGLVYVIQALLGRHYLPLASAPVDRHC